MIKKLEEQARELEQVAREIYYAQSFLPLGHPARANLKAALRILGVVNPHDVGLSISVLDPRLKTRMDFEG